MTDDKQPERDVEPHVPDHELGPAEDPEPNFMLLGIGIGISIGAVLGVALQSPGLWMGVGAALGVGAGNYLACARDRD